jgi:hypothetical protein
VYYPKVLSRPDPGHVLEAFTVAMPLFVLLAIEFMGWLDELLRRAILGGNRILEDHQFRHVASGISVVALLCGSVVVSLSAVKLLNAVPGRLHSSSALPAPSEPARLGYAAPGAVDTAQIEWLGRLLARYAGPTAPVIDYANELGITYYLLSRVPGTRFYPIAVAETLTSQRDTISDFKKSRPPVVIFGSTSFGLTRYDGIPQSIRSYAVTQYLLDNYRPLVDFKGQLLLLRDDLFSTAPPLPPLPAGSFTTTQLYFATPSCSFKDIPNFFALPSGFSNRAAVPAAVQEVPVPSTIRGWALDANGAAAPEVFATRGGQVVGRASTGINRLDVARSLHNPNANKSGFRLSIGAGDGPVTVWADLGDGSVAPVTGNSSLGSLLMAPSDTVNSLAVDGRTYNIRKTPAVGRVENSIRQTGRVYRLTFPTAVNLSSYEWLQLGVPGTLGKSSFVITDDFSASATHEITFSSIGGSPASESLMVGSCLQWHGYDTGTGIDVVVTGAAADAPTLIASLVK